MKTLLDRARDDSGQVIVFIAAIITALVGMAALVIDVGSWYQADRRLQTAADAAALAGAQHLPTDTAEAERVAHDFAQRNYAGAAVTPHAVPTTIDVSAAVDTPGIFAPVLSEAFEVVRVHAEAQAMVFAPSELKDVAPIAVYKDEACIVTNPGCFGQPVTLSFAEDAPYDPTKSKFGLLDLDRDGRAGAGDMKDWLEDGYSDYLPIDTVYPPANGEKNGIKAQLEDAADDQRVLLFPVFDTAGEAGYHVIGWAAFVIDDVVEWTGQQHTLTGHFVTFIATSLAAGNPLPSPDQDYGVHVITLTK
jgi:Putative Flp pilus-assembly TadE/G-like